MIKTLILLILLCPTSLFAYSQDTIMNGNIWITLGILFFAAVFFLTEAIPLAMTSILVPVLLVLFNIISYKEAFSGFSDQWVIMFLVMFIVGDALFRVGIAARLGNFIISLAKNSETLLIVYIMLATGLLSAFLSNTGTAACLLPIVLSISRVSKISPKKLLIPMAFASSIGGMNTLIGTPPNAIVQALYHQATGLKFGFFEFAKPGIVILIISIIYMTTIGKKYLSADSNHSTLNEVQDSSIQEHPDKSRMGPMVLSVFLMIIFFMVMSPLWSKMPFLSTRVITYLEGIPLAIYAIIGAVLIVSTRVMSINDAYKAIDWTTIFLLAGMLPMSIALEATGATLFIGSKVIALTGSSPYFVLFGIILVTTIVTNFMSNTATTVLFGPIAISIAQTIHVSPTPLLMAVCLSASSCFLTPVATPPNTLVLGPGGYKFIDYFKAGAILQLAVMFFLFLLIPIFFPF